MQQSFAPLVQEAIEQCKAFFGARLAAFYLHGSIAHGDAIAGISDLDTFLVIEDGLQTAEHQWLDDAAKALQMKYHTLVDGVHLTACSIADLKQNGFARFALKYNAIVMEGYDVVSQMPVHCRTGRWRWEGFLSQDGAFRMRLQAASHPTRATFHPTRGMRHENMQGISSSSKAPIS